MTRLQCDVNIQRLMAETIPESADAAECGVFVALDKGQLWMAVLAVGAPAAPAS